MALTDMKLNKKDRKKSMDVCGPYDGEQYPYGLLLELNDEALEKLGIKLPNVGDKFLVVAIGAVTSASEHRRQGGDANRSASIQLEKLDVSDYKKKTAVDAMDEALKKVGKS